MAVLDPIDTGTVANDGTGDTLRDAFNKANSNDQALNDDIGTNTNALLRIKSDTTATLTAGTHDITFSAAFSNNVYDLVFSGIDPNGFTVPVRLDAKAEDKFTVEVYQDTIVSYVAKKA